MLHPHNNCSKIFIYFILTRLCKSTQGNASSFFPKYNNLNCILEKGSSGKITYKNKIEFTEERIEPSEFTAGHLRGIEGLECT